MKKPHWKSLPLLTVGKDLTIQNPVLVSGNDRFSLGRPTQGEWVIKPNEHVVFDVSYAPQTFESNGAYIEIASDDPDEPTVRIHLEGYGDAPVLSVTPSLFDYGDISIGCDNQERITIRNEGNMLWLLRTYLNCKQSRRYKDKFWVDDSASMDD